MTSQQLARRLTGVPVAASGPPAGAGAVGPALEGRHRDAAARRLLLTGDLLAVALATALAWGLAGEGRGVPAAALTIVLWLALLHAFRLYDRDPAALRSTARDDVPGVLGCALVAGVVSGALGQLGLRLVPGAEYLTELTLVSVVLILGFRLLMRRATRTVLGPERVLVAAEPSVVDRLVAELGQRPDLGLEAAGAIAYAIPPSADEHAPSGGTADVDLAAIAAEHGVTHVLITSSSLDTARLLEPLRSCRRRGIKVSVISSLVDAPSPRAAAGGEEAGALGARARRLSPLARAAKRTVDVVGSGVALILFAPLMLTIAVAVRLDSPGPILFRQERIGYGGHVFRLVKFRTMVHGAEGMTDALRARSRDPDWLLLDHDPRVTRLGHFLRHWSVDELPQLWNVLKGDMSLVGPRPLILAEDDRVTPWARARTDTPPGLTGLWQVTGRTNMSFEEMIRLDCVYVAHWSIWRDLGIIARTVPAVLSRRGAN